MCLSHGGRRRQCSLEKRISSKNIFSSENFISLEKLFYRCSLNFFNTNLKRYFFFWPSNYPPSWSGCLNDRRFCDVFPDNWWRKWKWIRMMTIMILRPAFGMLNLVDAKLLSLARQGGYQDTADRWPNGILTLSNYNIS